MVSSCLDFLELRHHVNGKDCVDWSPQMKLGYFLDLFYQALKHDGHYMVCLR